VVSLLQRVTFLEYLTALFGSPSLSTYTGYNADVDPSISDVFANAAFKYAHSELNGEFVVMNSDGSIESVSLHEATLQPSFVLSHGVLPVLAGIILFYPYFYLVFFYFIDIPIILMLFLILGYIY